jgi:hypothetical protein
MLAMKPDASLLRYHADTRKCLGALGVCSCSCLGCLMRMCVECLTTRGGVSAPSNFALCCCSCCCTQKNTGR